MVSISNCEFLGNQKRTLFVLLSTLQYLCKDIIILSCGDLNYVYVHMEPTWLQVFYTLCEMVQY
jgi:hypothetical protein